MCKNLTLQPDPMPEFVDYWSDELSPFQLFAATLIVISGFTALSLIAHVVVMMLIRNCRQQWEDILQARIEDEISVWLGGDYTNWELTTICRKELKKDHRAEPVILNVIVATSKLFRREGQSALRELLADLNLDRVCYKLLESRHWYQQAHATQIISQLQMVSALPALKRTLKTTNTTLRLELITAIVSLGDQGWLRDVEEMNSRLSDWEQILLLERFRRLENDQLPPFGSWLTATHADWSLFGIRLCQHFNRFDKVPDLGALLKHDDERVQMAILDAFAYFATPETIPFLTNYLPHATGDRLLCALNLLGNQTAPYSQPIDHLFDPELP